MADHQYFACEDGRIFRFNGKTLVELKGWVERSRYDNSKYYRRYTFMVNKHKKKFYGQRLILFTFNGKPKDFEISRHKSTNTLDNSIWNLEWGTHHQNNGEDRIRDGTLSNGMKKENKIGVVVQDVLPPTVESDEVPF